MGSPIESISSDTLLTFHLLSAFMDMADGKLNGQKAFMSGKLKVKGNVMLATKLDGVLKAQKAKL